jgi:phage baseplate assembly protein W
MATPLLKRYFVGFSTQNSDKTGVRTLYDIDLINIDLMTAFQTRVGERLMRPDYGCRLWDYLMEPFTDMMRDQIISEAVRICALDSRLVLINAQVFEFDHGFRIEIDLQYLPWLVFDTFSATFQQNDQLYFGSNGTTTSSNLIG